MDKKHRIGLGMSVCPLSYNKRAINRTAKMIKTEDINL